MTMYAKVIADSIANDVRLTTLELSYPLMIHAQAKTHRMLSLDDECYIETNYSVGLMDDPMLSRNAQSNRAMPVAKMLEQVRNNPAMPSKWGKNQAGMSASEEFSKKEQENLIGLWSGASLYARTFSNVLREKGVHKQVANRLTMPFQYIKVIVTATDFSNFFNLRLNDADPTMMELAEKMREVMSTSKPKELKPGEWHSPMSLGEGLEDQLKSSVAACARISLNNHDGSSRELSRDIKLHDTLLKDGHMSCFEHQLTPMTEEELYNCEQAAKYIGKQAFYRANFNRWTSYRWKIENKSRV